jgi:hypothetical protein
MEASYERTPGDKQRRVLSGGGEDSHRGGDARAWRRGQPGSAPPSFASLPRLGSRVQIPSPAPKFINKIKGLKTVLRGRFCLEDLFPGPIVAYSAQLNRNRRISPRGLGGAQQRTSPALRVYPASCSRSFEFYGGDRCAVVGRPEPPMSSAEEGACNAHSRRWCTTGSGPPWRDALARAESQWRTLAAFETRF